MLRFTRMAAVRNETGFMTSLQLVDRTALAKPLVSSSDHSKALPIRFTTKFGGFLQQGKPSLKLSPISCTIVLLRWKF
jgi:hypothetical protein